MEQIPNYEHSHRRNHQNKPAQYVAPIQYDGDKCHQQRQNKQIHNDTYCLFQKRAKRQNNIQQCADQCSNA
ncbi:MAG: hypothetical protein QM610_05695 [Chitinophagaceae bacterium]